MDPLRHYLFHGAAEGRWPHPLFHTDWYLSRYPDVAAAEVNPLFHFIVSGASEGRDPCPLFATSWYETTYGAAGENPLTRFCKAGNPPTNPSPEFDAVWYRDRYLSDIEEEISPLAHYYLLGRELNYFINAGQEEELFRQTRIVAESGLFDAAYYAKHYDDVRQANLDPLQHFMSHGAKEGRTPHMLFDVGWYHSQTDRIAAARENPLLHFLQSGARSGFNPNAWFDSRWYLDTYPDCGNSNQNPLAHFLRHGGWETSPCKEFDALWYYRKYPDVAEARVNPLMHYLSDGLAEGRSTRPVPASRRPADIPSNAAIACLKAARKGGGPVALFVTHSSNGMIKGHVEHYVRAFVTHGVEVVLIVMADQRKTSVPTSLFECCSSIFVRENRGFDFAAWAHVLEIDRDLYTSDALYLVNDSLIGPVNDNDFGRLLAKAKSLDADVVGLTDNVYYTWHLQSFFLVLKNRALSNYGLHRFFQEVSNIGDKERVIRLYEIALSARLRAAGLTCRAIFGGGYGSLEEANKTLFAWKELVGDGFPFLKASLLAGEHREKGGAAAEAFLRDLNYDTSLIDIERTRVGEKLWANLEHPRPFPVASPRVSFIGPWNYANGLGVASRGYVGALFRTRLTCNISPIEHPFHVHSRTSPAWHMKSFAGPSDVAVVHVNGEAWDALLSPEQKDIVDRAMIRVGLFVWELSTLPAEWLPTINKLDAIWAPTEFCADIFRDWTDVPVQVVPHVVELPRLQEIAPEILAGLRNKLKLQRNKRVILYAFDGSSYLARKNPHALIRAFRASGLEREGWQLVLKTKHLFDIPTEGSSLMELIGNSSSIKVIDQPLTRAEFQQLFTLADIYASSHSSEGFGLTIAEAMAMGKIVVATDYGGTRDFLDATCGFPVRAEIATLAQDIGPYRKGGKWALVDEAALAQALRDAAVAVRTGSKMGDKARERIGNQLSIAAVAQAMEKNISLLLGARAKNSSGSEKC
jgi:glycosyltransferase involved in cell wall biosynthesis